MAPVLVKRTSGRMTRRVVYGNRRQFTTECEGRPDGPCGARGAAARNESNVRRRGSVLRETVPDSETAKSHGPRPLSRPARPYILPRFRFSRDSRGTAGPSVLETINAPKPPVVGGQAAQDVTTVPGTVCRRSTSSLRSPAAP